MSITTFWEIEEYKVWKGLDPIKPQWAKMNFVSDSYEDSHEILSLLEQNSPEKVFRIVRVIYD